MTWTRAFLLNSVSLEMVGFCTAVVVHSSEVLVCTCNFRSQHIRCLWQFSSWSFRNVPLAIKCLWCGAGHVILRVCGYSYAYYSLHWWSLASVTMLFVCMFHICISHSAWSICSEPFITSTASRSSRAVEKKVRTCYYLLIRRFGLGIEKLNQAVGKVKCLFGWCHSGPSNRSNTLVLRTVPVVAPSTSTF